MKSIYDIKTTGKFTPTQTFREKKKQAAAANDDNRLKPVSIPPSKDISDFSTLLRR